MTLPIDSSLLPAEVRAGGDKERKLYEAALGFERLLTNELTKSLAAANGVDGSDDGGSADSSDGTTTATSSATTMLQSQLPDLLASAIEQGGGLGLAPALYRSMSAKAAQ